ncbi:MAG: outer membrane beta-barrel protein, partial [Bdellovibrionales bacterium]|nr:outer membrane beta-barrel protein [Bdellovibrionales bacterium]
YQNERDKIDSLGADINEDYFSSSIIVSLYFFLPKAFKIQSFGGVSYFSFEQNKSFSYLKEWGGARVTKDFGRWFSLFLQSYYSTQQFRSLSRKDREYSISSGIRVQSDFIFNGSYTFQSADSSNPALSFDNHRVNLGLSVPLLSKPNDLGEPLVNIHLLGTLQIRNYPSVFGFTVEGERFLLSGAEDDNFNSITAKLTVHPHKHWVCESKYTRYSNELSSSQIAFRRSLLYGGVRYLF